MEVKAIGRHLRGSPRKARLLLDQIRGLNVEESLSILEYSKKRVAKDIIKIIESAVANAEENEGFDDVNQLFISRAYADGGTTMKRIQPRAMGRAYRIRKRTSHITIIICDGYEYHDEEE